MDDSKEINVYHSQLLHIDNTEIKSIVNAFSPIFCVRVGERNIKYKMTQSQIPVRFLFLSLRCWYMERYHLTCSCSMPIQLVSTAAEFRLTDIFTPYLDISQWIFKISLSSHSEKTRSTITWCPRYIYNRVDHQPLYLSHLFYI